MADVSGCTVSGVSSIDCSLHYPIVTKAAAAGCRRPLREGPGPAALAGNTAYLADAAVLEGAAVFAFRTPDREIDRARRAGLPCGPGEKVAAG